MQEICKIKQVTPPTTPSLSPPKTSKDVMQIMTILLSEGQESAQIIKSFSNEGLGLKVEDHNQADLDHHSLVILNSLENALSILKSYDFDVIRKRKLDGTNINECIDHSKDGSGTLSNKERRGCYKRRRNGQTWSLEATNLVDDGHAWRKYGQKDILNTKYPRNYYRCTHRHDQDCQATKQVQQISYNPTKYKIIYHGNHTCKNLQQTSSIVIDLDENSSYLLNFETKNYPTVKKNGPSNFFPSSSFHHNNHAMVKQQSTMIKEELPISPCGPHDHLSGTHTLQYSSCSENLPSSSDITSSTPVSDQVNSYDFEFDEDDLTHFLNMNHTHIQLDDIMKYSFN